MTDFAKKRCIPCEAGTPPMTTNAAVRALAHLGGTWKLSTNEKRIYRHFSFPDFKSAMFFLNDIAAIAESEGHHPDIYLSYNKMRIELWTHAIGGLSENDFIIAAKINELAGDR